MSLTARRGGALSIRDTAADVNTAVVETKHAMELYLDLISQPCRAVFLFAKVTGIPFEFKLVDLAAGKIPGRVLSVTLLQI